MRARLFLRPLRETRLRDARTHTFPAKRAPLSRPRSSSIGEDDFRAVASTLPPQTPLAACTQSAIPEFCPANFRARPPNTQSAQIDVPLSTPARFPFSIPPPFPRAASFRTIRFRSAPGLSKKAKALRHCNRAAPALPLRAFQKLRAPLLPRATHRATANTPRLFRNKSRPHPRKLPTAPPRAATTPAMTSRLRPTAARAPARGAPATLRPQLPSPGANPACRATLSRVAAAHESIRRRAAL